jgi:hypothetical protein
MAANDYGNQISKDTLRGILQLMLNGATSDAIVAKIQSLLAAKQIQPIPYTYNALFRAAAGGNSLASGANGIVQINIQADADFLILNQTYDANTANAARTASSFVVPNVNVLLTDTGSGYQMMDQAVPVYSIFGSGQFPYVLPNPKLMPAKATLQVQCTNYDAAAGYNLQLSFNGVKLFAYN